MPTTTLILGWISIHAILWLVQMGLYSITGDILPGCEDATTVMCGTPVGNVTEGWLSNVRDLDQSFNPIVVVRLAWNVLTSIWSVFTFDYGILNPGADIGVIHAIVGYGLRLAGTIGSAVMLISVSNVLLQAIRG